MRRVIELDEADARLLLWLVQIKAASHSVFNGRWARIAEEIKQCLDAQQNGEFFQCAACHDFTQE